MIAGYCWPQSVLLGDEVALHASTSAARFSVEVVRSGRSERRVWSADAVAGRDHPVPEDAAVRGCGWPPSLAIPVGDWPSGLYLVRLRGDDGQRAEAFFAVRASRPGRALLVLSTST